jgi:hypothetical protein
VPKADILRCGKNSLFDHLVGEQLHLIRDRQSERLSGFEVDDQLAEVTS